MLELEQDDRRFLADAVTHSTDDDAIARALLARLEPLALEQVRRARNTYQAAQAAQQRILDGQYITLQSPRKRRPGNIDGDTIRRHFRVKVSALPAFAEAAKADAKALLAVGKGERAEWKDWRQGSFYGGPYQLGECWASKVAAAERAKEIAAMLAGEHIEPARTHAPPADVVEQIQEWRPGMAV